MAVEASGAGGRRGRLAVALLGIGALLYALVPRAAAAILYGLVAAAFLWQLFGSLLGVPGWLVRVTPFAHIGLVPAQRFNGASAVVMAAIGGLFAVGALAAFDRRDIAGS